MSFSFDNNIPIYIQLAEKLKIEIISGKLTTGERLLSVRDLALNYKVNPNTMQRALTELEEIGLIFTERTNGKFVTEDKGLVLKYKKQYADSLVNNFFKSMSDIGFSKQDAINFLKEEE
ncbi:MAG: GntR family transcriptional regulator [Clostridia bacterium]|nr:GntR family transcriptional regulator [Clostridia bacterium]